MILPYSPELERRRERAVEIEKCRRIVAVGWVIERADSSPAEPKYWAAGQRDAERSSAWTSNHMAAIRFARYDDAEKVANRLFPDIKVRIAKHEWAAS